MRLHGPALLAVAKPAWLLLCLSVLAYAWLNRDIPGTDEAVLWALIVITFPIAITLATLGSGVFFLLDRFAVSVPGGFGFNTVFWVVSVVPAYWFWFVLMPKRVAHER